ncbi:TolC family protein [Rapidithrix thailandica]|uniref:TolC family protein n=1 Tax=Rapidithrix thailandica TaxID=413964 RepID=A0AAW9RV12_9BACT
MKRFIIFSLLFVTCINLSAWAQEPLSLSDAVQRGLVNNYDILIEDENIKISQRNNNWGEAGRYPTITFDVQGNYSLRDVDDPAAFVSGKTIGNSITPSLNLNWVLFDGFRVRTTKSRLEKLEQETRGNAEVVVQNTLQGIILAYYTAVLEKERAQVLQRSLEISREKYQYVQLKKELGSTVTTEVLLEEGAYLTDSINVINQEYVYNEAIRNLNIFLAEENVDRDYLLTDSLNFDIEDYRYEVLAEKMNSNNINLKTQYITQSILQENIHLAQADRYPKVTLDGMASYDLSRQDLSKADFTFEDPTRPSITKPKTLTLSGNLTVSFTLFRGGQIKRAIRNATTNFEVGTYQVDKLKQSLNRDLAQALDLYNNRKQLKGIASRRKDAAELNLTLSEEQYRTGTINSFDYRQVQLNYLEAALQDLEAIYNLMESNTNLMRLTGGLVVKEE